MKFELVKFCYIFFILYAINDILLKTIKNNIVACLCNVFYTNLSLEHNNTIQIQYNTDILFPIKEPFPAEQLTKNLIQWLWIDYIDWKMTTFYETRHHLTCVVLSHSTAGGDIYCLFSICCIRMKYKNDWLIWFLVLNATFSNISAISWRPVLVVEEAGENHRPWASNW